MKQLFPLALAILATACVAPKPGTDAHQRQLAKEARENFYAMKAAERQTAIAEGRLKPTPPPTHGDTTRQAERSEPTTSTHHVTWTRKAPPADDTIYYYDMPHGPEPTSARYRAYKLQYAQELAKSPANLTSEEREWVRRHYRDRR